MRFSTIFATASLFLSTASALTIPRYSQNARRYEQIEPEVVRRSSRDNLVELITRVLNEMDEVDALMSRAPPPKSRSPSPPPRSRSPSPAPAGTNPGLQALSTLSPVLQRLGVQYAVLGGAASAALGSSRVTTDVDLVIVAKPGLDAHSLSQKLVAEPGWGKVTEFGVNIPAVKVGTTLVPVEIFDAPSWPQRPQYGLVGSASQVVTLKDGVKVSVFNAQWQLREKIATAHQRGKVGTPKAASDMGDIRFLASKIPAGEFQKGLLAFPAGEYRDAFNAILKRPDMPKDLAASLAKIVKV